jgi:phosphate transport system permease protein
MSEPNLTATAELIALGVPEAPRRLPNLNRAPFEIRALKSGFLTALTWIAALLASVPLFSVIYRLAIEGGSRLDWEALTHCHPPPLSRGAVSATPLSARWLWSASPR